MLTGFSIENYRAFARRQELAIRPLTLFYGWNSGGKSALVRFLPLLAESVRLAGPPIWLAGEVGRGATWPELVCKSTQRGLLKFGLRWDNPGLSAEWEINGDLAGRWQETKYFSVSKPTSRWSRTALEQEASAGEPSAPSGAGNLSSPSLLPTIMEGQSGSAHVDAVRIQLNTLANQVQWISGVRVRPPRLATYAGGAPPSLRADGGDAVDHLIAAQIRSGEDPLLETTRAFFSALGETLILENPFEGAWRVRLHPNGSPQGQVTLCDTGEGYAQVLPVLVALARAQTGGPSLLCLEQPELHLHTRAQSVLAKLLVKAATGSDARVLVETHSEVLLMSVQIAIARGEIDPSLVRVYWVESRAGTSDAVPVDFDTFGRPTNTAITGAFDEAIQLGQDLLAVQLQSHGT